MIDNKKFAGIRLRLLASYVDLMILALPTTFLLWYAGMSLSIPILVQRLFLVLVVWILLFIIINLLHDIFFTHYFGGPIGKLLTGLKVVDEHGNKLTLKRSFFRHTVGYQFSAILFGLGFLAIIKDPQKQAWHDKAVGSKVIVEKKQWPLALFMLLFLLISNLYILYSAFNAAFSGPLPEEFKTFMNSFQTKKESQDKTPSVVTPKNNEFNTSDWQTYRNVEFGFEVKYPSNLVASPDYEDRQVQIGFPLFSGTSGKGLLYIQEPQDEKSYFHPVVAITGVHNSLDVVLSPLLEDVYSFPSGKEAIQEDEKSFQRDIDTSFLTSKGFEYKGISTIDPPNVYYLLYIDLDGKTLEIIHKSVGIIEEEKEHRPELFNQILSTFRFVESKVSNTQEGFFCSTDSNCSNLDCSKYPAIAPKGQEEGFCVFSGKKTCSQQKCTCRLICT